MPHAVATAEVITPRGRGAVATLILTGDADLLDQAQLFRAANGLSVSSQSLQRITFGDASSRPARNLQLAHSNTECFQLFFEPLLQPGMVHIDKVPTGIRKISKKK